MINRTPYCIYCGERMESVTAKKKYCSDKCRVYFNREYPNGKTISPVELASKLADKPKVLEIPVENQKTPPIGLKGIDLTIWKAENWK
jgi:tRNA(Ile2) C34 agmatinyltransferase TiaS